MSPKSFRCFESVNSIAVLLLILSSSVAAQQSQFSDSDLEFFENRVRPIFAEHCSECHSRASGDSAESLSGGFNVDSRASIIAGGETGPAIVPGKPGESLMIDAVNYRGHYEMPPNSKLPEGEIAILEDWVRRGAPWPDHSGHQLELKKEFDLQKRKAEHWAWQPVRPTNPPPVKDKSWALDPIDQFVLKRLNDANLSPAEDADKLAWLRRVYYDLIGLPPTPDQISAFLADDSDSAREDVVDRLLKTPAYGERWARHWMDLVRYAETYGHEYDYPIKHAWRYRDYLIRAFNEDVPYDDFIREHVAGDLLKQPRLNPNKEFNESIIGTGFWFLGEATHAPVDVKADEAGRIDNQIDVLCKTFLGMTVACARCHDHKFDAISTEDYYAMSGFLQSSRRQVAMLDPKQKISKLAEKAAVIAAENDRLVKQWLEELGNRDPADWISKIEQATRPPAADQPEVSSLKSLNEFLKSKTAETRTNPFSLLHIAAKNDDLMLRLQIKEAQKEWDSQKQKYDRFMEASEPFADFTAGVPSDWFNYGWAFNHSPQRLSFSAHGNLISHNSIATTARLGGEFQGVVRSPTFEITHDKIAVRAKGNGCHVRLIIDGYEMDLHNALLFSGCRVEVNLDEAFTWKIMESDIQNFKGHLTHLEIIDQGSNFIQVDEIRFFNNGDPQPVEPPSELVRLILEQKPGNQQELLESAASSLQSMLGNALGSTDSSDSPNSTIAEVAYVASVLAEHSAATDSTITKLKEARQQAIELASKVPVPIKVVAATDGTPENEHLFIRGNASTLGEKVPRRFLTAIETSDSKTHAQLFESGSGRMQLADQIASSDNPLTSRVIVNRLWHHLFGEGIVRSVDNFGVLGQQPSHPELLDYLAAEFTDKERNNWSLKQFIKRMVLTRTYRMSSQLNDQASVTDPDNRLLHRANISRLEGEAIRDAMLHVAGSLERKLYGKSEKVYLTEFMQGRGRPRASGPLDGNGRRSIYTEVRRNFLPSMMLAFDTPIPFNSIGNRHQSNVPAQALILMNDPFVVDQSKKWARRLMKQTANQDSHDKRIETAFLQAFGRPSTVAEIEKFERFIEARAGDLKITDDEIDSNEQIWQDFCHVLFNMKEFIYIR